MSNLLKLRLAEILIRESPAITILLSLGGLALSLGFLVGNPNNPATNSFGSSILWACGFTIYGLIKLLSPFIRIPIYIRLFASIAGLWGWNYIFLSFVIFDPTPVAPTEVMLIIPLVCELWALIILIFDRSHNPRRRKREI